jgi:outer membrane protein OmpA-like peptidoglycan-associated protein
MFRALIAFSFFFLLHFSAVAQSFRGVVIEDSLSKTPIYQATIKVRENGTEVAKLSTYFDGAFTYPTQKGKVYEFTATVPGTKDITINVITDKRGNPSPASAYFFMRKDGLRLVGRVKDVVSNMPIDNATVVLKDVQTREETRFTTNIDGLYNLKLKYETNYRVSIDKRSPGIINRFEDTVFFVSTIGFNLPLDYELDIVLQRAKQLTNRTEYTSLPESKPASKPIVEVVATPQKTEEKIAPAENKQTQKTKSETTVAKTALTVDNTAQEKKKKEEIKDALKAAKELEKKKKKEEKALAKNKLKQEKFSKETTLEAKKANTTKTELKTTKTNPPSQVENNTTAPPKTERVEQKIVEKLEQRMVQQTREVEPQKSEFAAVINFAKNAAYITDFSKGKLLPLLQQLKANSKTKIVLNAHAGKEETQPESLCTKRLTIVKQHFIANGIAADRILVKNNSSNSPFNDCHISGNCAEQLLILNRRIELKLVE